MTNVVTVVTSYYVKKNFKIKGDAPNVDSAYRAYFNCFWYSSGTYTELDRFILYYYFYCFLPTT